MSHVALPARSHHPDILGDDGLARPCGPPWPRCRPCRRPPPCRAFPRPGRAGSAQASRAASRRSRTRFAHGRPASHPAAAGPDRVAQVPPVLPTTTAAGLIAGTQGALPVLSPQVSSAEELRLTQQARTRIEGAERLMAQLDPAASIASSRPPCATIKDFSLEVEGSHHHAGSAARSSTSPTRPYVLVEDLSRGPLSPPSARSAV